MQNLSINSTSRSDSQDDNFFFATLFCHHRSCRGKNERSALECVVIHDHNFTYGESSPRSSGTIGSPRFVDQYWRRKWSYDGFHSTTINFIYSSTLDAFAGAERVTADHQAYADVRRASGECLGT
ncbi:hypothetical protein EVAR_13106_1 [Eumeta japonica]|uniref:Uncharacterized protein n=1 Tax=Eumeta variegata TaxID=151549 RepID=A0A4C1UAJ4_EUMVA|nr:hypothetical protein EVAR_13106_1 [Eumeta japonica]